MDKVKKVPEIRFKAFKTALGSDEIGNIISRKKSYSVTRSKETDEYTGLKYVHYGDIHTNKSKLIDKSSDLPNVQNDNYTNFLKKGDIILADASEDYEGVGNPAILLEGLDANVIAGLHTIAFEPNCSSMFLYYLLGTRRYHEYMRVKCTGTKVYGITFNNFKDFTVVYPSKPEQSQIGTFFKNLDEKLELEKEKHEKLINFKKAMLEDMFPKEGKKVPKVRFDGFVNEWKSFKIEDIGEVKTGKTPPTSDDSNYSDDGVLFITPTDIKSNVTSKTERRLSNKGSLLSTVVESETILVTCIASIGKNTLIKERSAFNQQINSVTPYKSNPYFIYTLSYKWSELMNKMAATGTMAIINKKDFSKINTLIPSPEEQALIGNFFKNLDEKIELSEKKIKKIENFKKAMLDKMFV